MVAGPASFCLGSSVLRLGVVLWMDPEQRIFAIGMAVGARLARQSLAAHEDALLVDAPRAARIMGISIQAFRQRVQRGQIPRRAIVRTGRRTQFIRARLPGA